MSEKIRNLGPQHDRVETGPVQFGDDWPGYFIRGDNAFALHMAIRNLLYNADDSLARMQVKHFGQDLLTCNVNTALVDAINNGLVAESADAVALKATAPTEREGSSPSEPTKYTPYQSYIAELPTSELPIEAGDLRLCAVDGFGPLEAMLLQVTDTGATIKVIGDPYDGTEFELDWDLMGPNTYIGWKVGGEEHKKYLADAEAQAVAAAPEAHNGVCC